MRLKLGIIFNFQASWMGGIIYILNLIRILNFLDEKDKPDVIVFYKRDLLHFLDKLDYTRLSTVEWFFPSVTSGFVGSWLLRENLFVKEILMNYQLDALFPMHNYPVKTISKTKLVAWYADLQHEYYPENFSRMQFIKRRARIKLILRNSDHLVLSSKTVEDDFRKFYQIPTNLRIHIFHFASVLENIENLDINELKTKYKLPTQYFIISNQFYRHKNHKVLFETLAILKKEGVVINYVLTGRLPENDSSPYIREINEIIDLENLNSQVSFLGVIPRAEQLLLIRHAQAVIQPTLFEGWSTVIEDAISLQVPVIASNIDVNIEQLGEAGTFFNPHKPSELAEILISYPARNLNDIFYEEYSKRVRKSAETFIKIFS